MTYATIATMSDHDPLFNESQSVSDQALVWLARMQKRELSNNERQRFEDWCASDPRHQTAYEQAEQFWRLLVAPAQLVNDRLKTKTVPTVRKPLQQNRLIWATCCVLLLSVFSLQLPGFFQDMQSDYVTSAGERQLVNLEDGSRVTLNTGSAIAIQFSQSQRTVQLVRGEAYFEVAANKARPFVVISDNLSARAVGTAFSVAAIDGANKEVAVSEGVVAVMSGDETRQLTVNQHVFWHNGHLQQAEIINSEDLLAWRHGQVVFSKQTLSSVIREVNRYRQWPIIVANRELAKRVISGVFKTDDPKTVISALTHTLSATAIGLPSGVVVIY
jgi:transmembrane sensor